MEGDGIKQPANLEKALESVHGILMDFSWGKRLW